MVWKTAQKKAKLRQRIRLASLTLSLIITVILVGNLLRVGSSLFSPINIQTKRVYSWDSNFNLNLVLTTNPVSILSYNPVEGKISILEIPDKAYIEVPGGYGFWKLGAVHKLGEVDNPPIGVKLLRDSLQNYLALPIDGVIEVRAGDSEQFMTKLRGNPLEAFLAVTSVRTDLSPIELTQFVFGARGVRFDKVSTYNLEELELLTSEKLADGEDILVSDPIKIDVLLTKHFADTKVLGESATIAVLNATNRQGLAAKTAQMVTHLGGNVIIQSSFEKKIEKSVVSGDNKYPYTTKRLQQIFGRGKLEDLGRSASDISRASVNLILGQQ